MELKEMTLRETQCVALDILKKIDSLCSELGIEYSIVYGTLLGAVRHKGFIPWDDDIDIGMKLDDYNKFVDYFVSHSDELSPLEIHNHKTKKDCFYNISRVCDSSYILKFDGLTYESGVFVDIYPFEGLGKDTDRNYWNAHFDRMPVLKKGLSMCCSSSIFYGKNIFTKIANLPYMLFIKIVGKDYLVNKLMNYKKISFNESDYVGCPCWERTYQKKSDYDNMTRMQFEDFMVSVPCNYDNLLKKSYGNYMEYPPENQRSPGHKYKAYKKVD